MMTVELMLAQKTKLMAYARCLTHSVDDAEDLWQDTLEYAWRGRHTYQDKNPAGWLSRIMFNRRATKFLRRKSVESVNVSSLEAINEMTVGNGGPALCDATRAFAKLTPLERRMISMVVAGYTYLQIGVDVGLREENVKKRMFRAREKLEKFL